MPPMGLKYAVLTSSPAGQRADDVGKVVLYIVGFIVLIGLAVLIGSFITKGFALAWEHAPWLVVIWGLSGIAFLTLAFIYSAHALYYVGGWDLGIFIAIWIGTMITGQLE